MKIVPGQFLERKRIIAGELGSTAAFGMAGAFLLTYKNKRFFVISSSGGGWEHVSVSHKNRTPTWEEMCFVKDLFWEDEEIVIQYHPKKSEYVNNCKTALHLWKPIGIDLPTPPIRMVGIKP